MPLDLARKLAQALNVRSESQVRVIDEVLSGFSRLVPLAGATPITGTPTGSSKTLTRTTVTATSYTLTDDVDVVLVDDDTAGGEVTINLPALAGVSTVPRYIKKLGSTAGVIIDGNGAETIDGQATVAIALQYECLVLLPIGTGWSIL